MPRLRFGSQCVTGNYRENNEDRCFADPDGRFFLVADGMGGQSAGEKASELATQIVPRQLVRSLDFARDAHEKIVRTIDEAVAEANNEIMALGELDPDLHNMGTTLVFLVAAADRIFVGGVGDSRVYRIRQGAIEQLTKDHSVVQALIDAGTITPDEAATNRYRNVLYRYLGTKEGSTGTEPKILDPAPGDRFVLCSDGVTDGIDSDVILERVVGEPDPQRAAEAVVQAALDGGSKDNVTCVVVLVE